MLAESERRSKQAKGDNYYSLCKDNQPEEGFTNQKMLRTVKARAPEAGRGRPWFLDPAVNDLWLDFGGERPPAVAGRGRRDRPWPAQV